MGFELKSLTFSLQLQGVVRFPINMGILQHDILVLSAAFTLVELSRRHQGIALFHV